MNSSSAERAPTVLRLPGLREEGTPGSGIVRRGVSLIFIVLGGLLLLALAVSTLVTVDVTAEANGILEPVRVWSVRSQEAGTVAEVLVVAGDSVTAGQPLVRLDTLQLGDALAQVRSTIAEARIEYERVSAARVVEQRQIEERHRQAEAAAIRARALLRQRLAEYGMPHSLDSLLREYRAGEHTAIDLAVADVLSAESEVRSVATQRDRLAVDELNLAKQRAALQRLAGQAATTRARLGRLVVRAPAAGIVLTEGLEQLVGGFVREGDLLMEVADTGAWHATLYVSERDVHEVHVGDPVKIEVQAFSRDRDLFRGHVVYVAEEPVTSESGAAGLAGLYRVLAALEASSLRSDRQDLRRGYTVRGNIVARSGRILALLWQHLMHR